MIFSLNLIGAAGKSAVAAIFDEYGHKSQSERKNKKKIMKIAILLRLM